MGMHDVITANQEYGQIEYTKKHLEDSSRCFSMMLVAQQIKHPLPLGVEDCDYRPAAFLISAALVVASQVKSASLRPK